MDLTQEEIELTAKLGFDLAVVSRIKDEVGMPFKEFQEEDTVSPNVDNIKRHSAIWSFDTKQMQVSILKNILAHSPDAADLINGWIAELEGPLSEEERRSQQLEEQDREFWQKAAPYSKYLAAENDRIRKESLGGHVALPSFWMNSDCGVEARLEQMKAYFAGKPEPKAKAVIEPVGMVFAMETFNWQMMHRRLQKELLEQGYKLDALVQFHFIADFLTKKEAEQFKESRKDLPCLEIISLSDGAYEVQPSTGSRLLFKGDEKIIRTASGKYKVVNAGKFRVSSLVTKILLSKRTRKKSTRVDKYQLLLEAGTAAPNAGLGPDEILAQLKKWDKLYGIEIESATYDSVKVKFSTLPDDLRLLCSEMFMFCSDLDVLYSDSFEDNACRVREFALSFRRSKTVGFWWD